MEEVNKKIKELIVYARGHLDLEKADEIYLENILLGEFEESHPYNNEVDEEAINKLLVPDSIITPLTEYLEREKGLTNNEAERFITKIMGFLTPRPSAVNDKFEKLHKESPQKAADYLYNLSIWNNYIQKTKVDKNLLWEAKFPNNTLEISINLSKPEKNNKDIKKLLTVNLGEKYPKCLLCKENLGFYGNDSHPARENIRFVPLRLNNEEWFMQYSPYVYYDHHCIVLSHRHNNMHIDRPTLNALVDFVDYMPCFFIGSNADLPIVGGSILNHEHFQGGAHILPMLKANVLKEYYILDNVKVSKLDWYNTCILLETKDKNSLLNVAENVLDTWKNYDDIDNDILHFTDEQHNTITPVVRKIDDTYKMYLILRNNRTNEKYPDGIFHAHPEYHMIKKEGIGLIEAMGLFILPARLVRQFKEIEDVYGLEDEKIVAKYPDLKDFLPMIKSLPGNNLKKEIEEYVNNTCRSILENVGVFKNTEKGTLGFNKFIEEVRVRYGKK